MALDKLCAFQQGPAHHQDGHRAPSASPGVWKLSWHLAEYVLVNCYRRIEIFFFLGVRDTETLIGETPGAFPFLTWTFTMRVSPHFPPPLPPPHFPPTSQKIEKEEEEKEEEEGRGGGGRG